MLQTGAGVAGVKQEPAAPEPLGSKAVEAQWQTQVLVAGSWRATESFKTSGVPLEKLSRRAADAAGVRVAQEVSLEKEEKTHLVQSLMANWALTVATKATAARARVLNCILKYVLVVGGEKEEGSVVGCGEEELKSGKDVLIYMSGDDSVMDPTMNDPNTKQQTPLSAIFH
jgi:hypothetical protein